MSSGYPNLTTNIPDGPVVFSEIKICEQGSRGCNETFIRPIGSIRKVCDNCMMLNLEGSLRDRQIFSRETSPSSQDRKDAAWDSIKEVKKQERNSEHIYRACLRKFAYSSFGAALKTSRGRKGERTHKNERKMQPYVCHYRINDSVDEARRKLHFHVGQDHEDFEGSAF